MGEMWDVLDRHRRKTGRLHERGRPMKDGEYHLIVHVWILNAKREFLITKRSPGESAWANLWHTTGGCAVAGDDSITTALKETKEEIGISLTPQNGRILLRYMKPHDNDEGGAFYDIWLFRQDIDGCDVVLQPEEVCDARWANPQDVLRMMHSGEFLPLSEYPYLDALFEASKR